MTYNEGDAVEVIGNVSHVVCAAGHPFGIIGELTHTWVTTDPQVAVNGYVCVISKTRAVEPFELPGAD